MFDAAPTPALPSGQGDASDEEDEGDEEEDAGGLALNGRLRKREAKGQDQGSRAAAVIAMLQQVSEEQVQEIAQVCRWGFVTACWSSGAAFGQTPLMSSIYERPKNACA